MKRGAFYLPAPELGWAPLKRLTDRFIHEVPGIRRVAYDLAPKPAGTVERRWS